MELNYKQLSTMVHLRYHQVRAITNQCGPRDKCGKLKKNINMSEMAALFSICTMVQELGCSPASFREHADKFYNFFSSKDPIELANAQNKLTIELVTNPRATKGRSGSAIKLEIDAKHIMETMYHRMWS